ncbi:hypothetical protein ABT084_09685 [Streptomyces sp. NPDC002138]|uniref:hypothetical protein n=1 Tax=Streptomyces sp. NPDC002138 TaxID=3154410 RepID=UPI00331F9BBE
MNPTSPTAGHPAATQERLLVPLLFTVLVLVASAFGYATSYLPDAPVWLCAGYLVPLGLALSTWLPPRTPGRTAGRIAAGVGGVVLALTYAKAVEAVLFVAAIGLWLVHGD